MTVSQLVAMKIERRALARLRKSCGMPFVDDDGRPGAMPGLVVVAVLLCAAALAAVGLGL